MSGIWVIRRTQIKLATNETISAADTRRRVQFGPVRLLTDSNMLEAVPILTHRMVSRVELLLPRDLPIHGQQSHALHTRVMGHVDHVGYVLEIDIGVSADEDDFLCALQIDLR